MAVRYMKASQLVQRHCFMKINVYSVGILRLKSSATTEFKSEIENTTVITPTTSKIQGLPLATEHPKNCDLSFCNAREAFKSKKTSELIRALFVFNACSIPFLVNYNKQVLKWSRKILGKTLFCKIMKSTFYGHFVAGEDQISIKPLVDKYRQFGVKSILDYSVEKDISSEEAKEAEMKGCVSANQPDNILTDDEIGSNHRRFMAHEEFGDRREKVVEARTYFYEDEANCDRNTEIFLNCIDAVSGATEGTGFVAIKMTALGRPQLLLQLSDVLVSIRQFFDDIAGSEGDILLRKFGEDHFRKKLRGMGISISKDETNKWFSVLDISKDGEVDLLDWDNLLEVNIKLAKLFVVPNLKTGEVIPLMTSLTDDEETQMKNMLRRLNRLAEYAQKKGVRIMVDAEQTYFQPAIRRLTMEMMRKFNKESPVMFNTYQCYLKSAYDCVCCDLDLARRENFHFGAKLVRGAYMEQERERAVTIGYEDPINPSYDSTSEMYHKVLELVMKQINQRERGKIAVMVASHNEDTIRFTVEKMKQFNIMPVERLICFGQLLGMCDQVSFPLGQAGYSVYKYVPYGPVEDVLPYLSRRAIENRGVLKKVKKEKSLLWKELGYRLKNGQIMYEPMQHLPKP